MEKSKIKEIFLDQRNFFLSQKELIERDIDLKQYLKTKQIVLISGIRRCGKSSLLYLIKNKLNLEKEKILYFNFDDERLGGFEVEDFNKIFELHIELFNVKNSKNIIMFFDEIQNIEGWEKFLNRMYEKGLKIFVTGSNAKLLSSEIATSLTGRNLTLNLFPFSFKEFLFYNKYDYKNLKLFDSEKKSKVLYQFNRYLKYGGFPLVVLEKNLELVSNYYRDILYRDIISRFNISQIEEIKILGSFFATNIGKIFSYSSLQEITKIKSFSTLKNYIDYFENSFIFYYLKKFDYSLKKQILNSKKVYVSDLTFSSIIGFKFSEDRGRFLENTVFIELKRRDKEIYYHREKKECDFVIKEGLKIVSAIQVCSEVGGERFEVGGLNKTKKREIEGLIEAMKIYNLKEGLILTENEEMEESFEVGGERLVVRVVPIWKWILETND